MQRIGALFLAAALAGCSSQPMTPEQAQFLGNAMACAANPRGCGGTGQPAPVAQSVQKIMVFGGQGHRQYLGCLSCQTTDLDAVSNPNGQYGSVYSPTSVRNRGGEFGSPFSAYSACNMTASDPPVVVDANGNYYGRLTINQLGDQVRNDVAIGWLHGVCGQ